MQSILAPGKTEPGDILSRIVLSPIKLILYKILGPKCYSAQGVTKLAYAVVVP